VRFDINQVAAVHLLYMSPRQHARMSDPFWDDKRCSCEIIFFEQWECDLVQIVYPIVKCQQHSFFIAGHKIFFKIAGEYGIIMVHF